MAYTRKRGRNTQSRLRARRRRTRAGKKSVAAQTRSNSAKIAKLASQALGWRQYQYTVSNTLSASLHVERLMDPSSNFTPVFQAENNLVPVRAFNMSTLRFKYAYQVESDTTGNQWFQMWVVSLKPKFAREMRATTNDVFNLVDEQHYITSAMGSGGGSLQGYANVMLNPAFFKVHHTTGLRRIGQETMGADTPVTNIRDSTHHGSCTIPWKKTLKAGAHRANGIQSLDHLDIKDSSCLYTIVFSNAGSASELFYAHNYLYTGTTLATN